MLFREKSNLISKFICLAVMLGIGVLYNGAFANTVSSVEVRQTDANGYDVMLKLDKSSHIKKITNGKDNITLIINSALPSETIDIVYDNASDLKNVVVQKRNSENTLISMQGKNIQNAKIYTNELSTGITKQISSNPLSGFFVVTDKKAFGFSVLAIFLLFVSIIASKPKKQYSEKEIIQKSIRKYNKKQTINSMKRRKRTASHTIPSINYSVNGSFSASNANMSVPTEFIINRYQEQQKRKVG